MNVDLLVNNTYDYILQNGYFFPKDTIYNVFLSLKSQQFVIFSGQSGSGKSSLASLFAQSVGATEENGRFKVICTEPGWQTSAHLFGSCGPDGKFRIGEVAQFIKESDQNPTKPYFICLEDFTLSRPDLYMNTLLSLLSRRKVIDGKYVSPAILPKEAFGNDEEAYKLYGDIKIGDNLYIFATTASGDCAYPIPPKLLEYAFVMEIKIPDFNFELPNDESSEVFALDIDNEILKPDYVTMQDYIKLCTIEKSMNYELNRLNQYIFFNTKSISMHTRTALLTYSNCCRCNGIFLQNNITDYIILLKILPQIYGATTKVYRSLCDLFITTLSKGGADCGDDDINTSAKMAQAMSVYGTRYPCSAEKIIEMVRRFEDEGYTSF